MMTMAQAAARHGSCHTPFGDTPLVYKCWSPDFSGRKSGCRPGLCRAADGPGRSSNTANPNHLYKYSAKSLSRDAGKLDEEIGLDWYYFGARYYPERDALRRDPEIARWMAVDPLMHKYPSLSPYNYVLNNPIIAIDEQGEDVLVVISGDVNRTVTRYNYASQWDQGRDRGANTHFTSYNMDVYDFGNQPYYGGDPEYNGISWLNEHHQFEIARDAWGSTDDRSAQRYGSYNETPPNEYEISDRTQETSNTKGKAKGWLGINDPGQIGGTILSGSDGSRYGISIHPGNPNHAHGCLTMSRKQFVQFRTIVLKSLKNGQKVYIQINQRMARYNSELNRWEYLDDEETERN